MLGAILAGAGALGGLLGIGRQGYGQADQLSGQAGNALQGEQGIGTQYGQLGQGALGSYGNYNNQYQGAVNNYGNYLSQDPFTDQRSSADLNRATSGTANAYSSARGRLYEDMQNRGLGTPESGGMGSSMAGGLSNLANQYTGTMGNAQNQEAYNQIGQRQQNMANLTNLYGGAAGTYYGRGMQDLGSQAGLDQNVANGYGQLAGAAAARTDQYNQGINNMWGGVAGLGGSMIGQQQGMQQFHDMYSTMNGNGGQNPATMTGSPQNNYDNYGGGGGMQGYGGIQGLGGLGAGALGYPGQMGINSSSFGQY